MCVGRFWLEVAKAGVFFHVARVESAANIADGPTREDLILLQQLKAQFVPPRLPDWVHDFLAWTGVNMCLPRCRANCRSICRCLAGAGKVASSDVAWS